MPSLKKKKNKSDTLVNLRIQMLLLGKLYSPRIYKYSIFFNGHFDIIPGSKPKDLSSSRQYLLSFYLHVEFELLTRRSCVPTIPVASMLPLYVYLQRIYLYFFILYFIP